jgi:hypothetical protein
MAFKPVILPTAGFELTVMAHTIGKLVEGDITAAVADGVVSALDPRLVNATLLISRAHDRVLNERER